MAPQAGIGGGRAAGRAPTVFHEGERAVQRRAGVERVAAQVGRNILPFVPVEFGEFLARKTSLTPARHRHCRFVTHGAPTG